MIPHNGAKRPPKPRKYVWYESSARWPTGRERAPCRALSYPRRSREKLRGVFLGQRLTDIERCRGQEPAEKAVID